MRDIIFTCNVTRNVTLMSPSCRGSSCCAGSALRPPRYAAGIPPPLPGGTCQASPSHPGLYATHCTRSCTADKTCCTHYTRTCHILYTFLYGRHHMLYTLHSVHATLYTFLYGRHHTLYTLHAVLATHFTRSCTAYTICCTHYTLYVPHTVPVPVRKTQHAVHTTRCTCHTLYTFLYGRHIMLYI